MRNFNINYEDLNQIERLLKINTNIDKVYTKLCTLEIEGKKNTEEYIKYLNYLTIYIEGEEKIYNDPNMTPTRLLSWTKFLFDHKRKTTFDIIENIMKQNYDDRILTRLTNTLLSKITKNYNNLSNLPNKELQNILTMYGIMTTYDSNNKDIIIIKNNLENDIYYTFLSFMQEQIEDPNQKLFKENLITAKYNTIFINKDIEAYLLTNNFNIKTNTYISSDIISDLFQINQDITISEKNGIAKTIIFKEINELPEITNIDYNDITKVTTSILRQCMLNASLLFINNDAIEEIKNITNKLFQYIEFQIIYPNSSISNKIIENCFKNIKRNKEKIKRISLK